MRVGLRFGVGVGVELAERVCRVDVVDERDGLHRQGRG